MLHLQTLGEPNRPKADVRVQAPSCPLWAKNGSRYRFCGQTLDVLLRDATRARAFGCGMEEVVVLQAPRRLAAVDFSVDGGSAHRPAAGVCRT
jgi:hypothetical protein